MRTNIVIDPALMAAALAAGPYKTKKEAVEAGLRLLVRRTAYREVLALKGKLNWDAPPWDDLAASGEAGDASSAERSSRELPAQTVLTAGERPASYDPSCTTVTHTAQPGDDPVGTEPHAGR